jgi:membrane-bound lytic murein transglycosylase B
MPIPLNNWQALGVRGETGAALPNRPGLLASLVTMDDGKGPSYLTYPNFRAILSYNCSNF